jgi:hypothetical protein
VRGYRVTRALIGTTLLGLVAASACGGESAPGTPTSDAGASGEPAVTAAGGDRDSAGATASTGNQPSNGGAQGGVGAMHAGGALGVAGSEEAGATGMPDQPSIPPGTGTLGSACTATVDCRAGLGCVTATDTTLGGASPPHGLCTTTCTDDTQCATHSAGSICFPFEPSGFQGYCIEGCSFGADRLFRKCHARLDFSCMAALIGDTAVPCEEGCLADEVCSNGTCQTVIPGCLPTCRGDIDCAKGLYCDQSFGGGMCSSKKPTGKRLGEPCTVPGPLDPLEPDECLGFCQPDAEGSSTGRCYVPCGLGNDCAWDATSRRFDGVCYYQSAYEPASGVADFGYCTPTCNCAADCNEALSECYNVTDSLLSTATHNGAGLCFVREPEAGYPVVERCQ